MDNEFTFYWLQFEQLYRKYAKRWHPDKPWNTDKDLANRRMQWLNAARDYLQALGG